MFLHQQLLSSSPKTPAMWGKKSDLYNFIITKHASITQVPFFIFFMHGIKTMSMSTSKASHHRIHTTNYYIQVPTHFKLFSSLIFTFVKKRLLPHIYKTTGQKLKTLENSAMFSWKIMCPFTPAEFKICLLVLVK